MTPQFYKFTDFTLDVREQTLFKNGEPLKIKNRNFQVLRLLVENAGNVVTKQEFFEQIWQGAFVEDNNLTVSIAQIRKTLGETKKIKFIETVPKKGYRFIAEVETVFDEDESVGIEKDSGTNKSASRAKIAANFKVEEQDTIERPSAKTRQSVFAAIGSHKTLTLAGVALIIFLLGVFWQQNFAPMKNEPLERIAVLPFAANGDSADERIFAQKLTQELTYNLGRITDVRVSPYHAVADYDAPDVDPEKIKTELKVDALVTGKIQAKGEIFDLKVDLIDLRTGTSLWEKLYSLKSADFSASQYRLARDIARQIGKDKETANTFAAANFEAYQAYLAARHHLGRQSTKDYEKAVENFKLATAKDASFADAHSGLATTYVLKGLNLYAAYGLSASIESFPAAQRSAERALQLNPNSDEALAALAFINYRYEYDWESAEDNFRRAIEINPNNSLANRWFGEFLHKAGRFDEGFAVQKNALALSPASAQIFNDMAWGGYLAGRLEEAAEYVENALSIDKTKASALYNASEIYEHKADYDKAVALWKEAMKIESANIRWIDNLEESFQKEGYRGFLEAKTAWLEDLIEKDYVYPTDLAKGYAALGENDLAIEWLEKGIEARIPDILSIKYAAAFDSIKTDTRFQEILIKMNFPK